MTQYMKGPETTVLNSIFVHTLYLLTVSTNLCFWHSFDDFTRINSRFWLLVTWLSSHGRDASSHKIWCRYLYLVRSYWHFSKMQDGGSRHLGFLGMWIWPFRRVDSVVLVLCTKFGSNFCYCHWDWRTYPSDFYLIVSHELTSGFDFIISARLWCIFT